MDKLPPAMRQQGRKANNKFRTKETLFRRVPDTIWSDKEKDFRELEVDIVELPDISVGRSMYGHAEWVRFDVEHGIHYETWGVVGITVEDIPREMYRADGTILYTLKPVHVPLEKDYPHSEVRAYSNGKHLQSAAEIPHDVGIVWREKMLRKLICLLQPFQIVVVRQQAPASYTLESFITPS